MRPPEQDERGWAPSLARPDGPDWCTESLHEGPFVGGLCSAAPTEGRGPEAQRELAQEDAPGS